MAGGRNEVNPHTQRARPKGIGSKETRTGAIELITACQNERQKQMADPVATWHCGIVACGTRQVANAIASLLSHL